MQLFTAKAFAIFFGLATVAFTVSTIVLAVQKGELQDELDEALTELENLKDPTTTTSTTPGSGSKPTGVTDPIEQTPTDSGNPTNPSNPSDPTKPTQPGPPTPSPTTPSTTTPSTSTPSTSTPSTSTPSDTDFPNPNDIIYRLPTDIRPVKYQLYLYPHLEEGTFEGTINIGLGVDRPTNVIALHSKDLDIAGVSVLPVMAKMRIKIKAYYTDPTRELLIIELGEQLQLYLPYTLSVSFRGALNGLNGFYSSSYIDQDGNQKWIATSKFEPTYARQAFPCFDEPAMKTYFEVTLVHPTGGGYHALSNMDVFSTTVKGDITEVLFADTAFMSTYLACFIISDFDYKIKQVTASIGHNFDMRVFATPAQVNKTDYALNTGVAVIENYISYFNLSYPLPKLDMAAIPDFVSGAMEHWGLVTYRETALLYDENTSSSANKQRVATVIAHELAHMWFGNLVTMKWWNDLWLNEGFASYIEYRGVHAVHPEWKMLDQFIISDLHSVLKLDGTLASHPIVQTVESPNEITELFDSITYSKGASVIRMLEGLVSEDVFREVVHNYLYNYQYINAETEDFFNEFESFNLDFDVKLIMKTWTAQMGLPVVEVTKVSNSEFKLTQKRFFSNPSDYEGTYTDSEFNYRWSIPITYITSANPVTQSIIFNYNDSELTLSLPSSVQWLKINKNQVGYYRVNYPEDIWQQIKNALIDTPTAFSVSDRAHLLNDAFALADATQLSFDIALDLTKYLESELEYVPWSVASSKLISMKNLLYYTDAFQSLRTYSNELLNKAYEYVGWEVDANNHLKNLLRVKILDAACEFGHANCLQEVGTRFTAWLSDPNDRPKPDLRNIIYYYGMSSAGTEEKWKQLWDLFKAETDASEKLKLMNGLAAIKEPWILQRFIELAWDENNVRGQDYFTCLQYIAGNPVGQSLVWDYVRENWENLVERFGINERYLGRLIPSITGRFITNQKLEEMENFFAKYPEAGAGTAARKEALENVKANINWVKQNKPKIQAWLAAN